MVASVAGSTRQVPRVACMVHVPSARLQRVAPREERRVLWREATHDGVQSRPEPRRADGRA